MDTAKTPRKPTTKNGTMAHDLEKYIGSPRYTHSCSVEVMGEATARVATNGEDPLYKNESTEKSIETFLAKSTAPNTNCDRINATSGKERAIARGNDRTHDASRGAKARPLLSLPH